MAVSTTPFIHEVIAIIIGTNISHKTTTSVRAYTDCKSTLTKVKDMITPGLTSALHLSYGPILSAIKTMKLHYQIEWIESTQKSKRKTRYDIS